MMSPQRIITRYCYYNPETSSREGTAVRQDWAWTPEAIVRDDQTGPETSQPEEEEEDDGDDDDE